MHKLTIAILVGFSFTGCRQRADNPPHSPVPAVHSVASALNAFRDIHSLPRYLEGEVAMVSSYDTTGGNDDGFSGKYSFLKRNQDSSLVIFDVRGSGVIDRIWTPTPNQDTLDFYIDDLNMPALSIAFSDLFSGQRFPFVSPLCGNQVGGYYCYFPIPFGKSCRIVTRGKRIQFHQIQYRRYPEGTAVTGFKDSFGDEERVVLKEIENLWNKPQKTARDFYVDQDLSEKTETFQINPGESKELFSLDHGGRILGIELSPASVFSGLTKDLDLRITWDDEKLPAVLAPVADFFGFAFGSPSMQSLIVGTRDGVAYCYFPMPFDDNANVALVYRAADRSGPALKITSRIFYSNNPRDPATEGKFYATWSRLEKSRKGEPHVFADLKGKGHYVATILQSQGKKSGMTYFFEGDDSTAIDGQMRMHGTGSEDYFNGGWYALMDRWEGKMSLPLHGALDYSLAYCRTGGYRLFVADKMSFDKSIFHSIEHGPTGNAFPVDYTSVALYYCDTAPASAAIPTHELTRIFIPDTLFIYPQLADFTLNGNMSLKTTWQYRTGGESYIFNVDDQSGLRVSLKDIPYGTYRMQLDLITRSTGCDVSVWQRQTRVSEWQPTFSKEEKRVENIEVCELEVGDFRNTITFRFKTSAGKNVFLLNRLVFIRQN